MESIYFNLKINIGQWKSITNYYNMSIKISNGAFKLPVNINVLEQVYMPVRTKLLHYLTADLNNLPFSIGG